MSSIASVSSSAYTAYSSSSVAGLSAGGSTGPSGAVTSAVSGNLLTAGADAASIMQNNAMFASFQQAMGSGNPMQMLVALLIMNALLGNSDEDQQKKSKEALSGLAALAMLGPAAAGGAGITISNSMNITIGSSAAATAYGATIQTAGSGGSSTMNMTA